MTMLDALLAPFPVDRFLRDCWSRELVHVPGAPGKLAAYFSWDVLNDALERQRFTPRRLGLVHAGDRLPPARYMNAMNDGTFMVDAAKLRDELSRGATLIFNSAEEVHRPLRDLCGAFERVVHRYVHANLYAGWRATRGFDVHWDDQNTVILQIAGRKRWRVWKPTRVAPFKRDVVDTSPATRPDGPPDWERVLVQGDVLSVPRGWWHVAEPLDEPCLHLTVTVKDRTGIDLLHWLASTMKASDAARGDLPLTQSPEARRAWLDRVWADLRAAWEDAPIERYLVHLDAPVTPRPHLALPDLAPAPARVDPGTPLRLARPRPLMLPEADGDNATVTFEAAGMAWTIAREIAPLLRRFNDGRAHTIEELSPSLDPRVQMVVMGLVLQGALVVDDAPERRSSDAAAPMIQARRR